MARRRLPSCDPVEAGAARDRQENAVRIRSQHGVPLRRWESVRRFECERGIAAAPIDLNVLSGAGNSQCNGGNDADHNRVISDRMDSVVRAQEQRVNPRRAERRSSVCPRRVAESHRSRPGVELPRDCWRRVCGFEADEARQVRRCSRTDSLVRSGIRNRRIRRTRSFRRAGRLNHFKVRDRNGGEMIEGAAWPAVVRRDGNG